MAGSPLRRIQPARDAPYTPGSPPSLPGGCVQEKQGNSDGSAYSFPSPVTLGNTIIVGVCQLGSDGGIPSSVTDNLGNVYTRLVFSRFSTDFDFGVSIWSAPVTNAGTCTITVAGGTTNYNLEGMIFAVTQRWAAVEVTGTAVCEQTYFSDSDGTWESGNMPDAGPTSSMTTNRNLSFALVLGMIFGGGETTLNIPDTWYGLALHTQALDPGTSIIVKEFNSTTSPSVTWNYVPTGAGSQTFWQSSMANFRLPAVAPSTSPKRRIISVIC